jgi:hypothetical protein
MKGGVKALLNNKMSNQGSEEIDWRYYDSQLMAASSTQTLSFFQNSIGSVGKARTNMQTGGTLPAGKGLAVTQMDFHVINSDGTPFFFAGGAAPTIDFRNTLFAQMYFEFKLDQSTMYEGHGTDIFEPLCYMNDTGTTLGVTATPSSFQYKPVKFKTPLMIPAVRNFSVNVTCTTPAAAKGFSITTTFLYITISGLVYRVA